MKLGILKSMPVKLLRAIAFHLANRADIGAYLVAEEEAFEAMPQPLQTDDLAAYHITSKTW